VDSAVNWPDSGVDAAPLAACGNGVREPGEECDLGAENDDNRDCTASCRNAVCGDGLIQKGVEQCDPGGKPSSCYTNCQLAPSGVIWSLGYEQSKGRGIFDLVLHPNGDVIAVGTVAEKELDFWLQRYGDDGREVWNAPTIVDAGGREVFNAVALDQDAKIVAAGTTDHGGDDSAAAWIAKFTSNGEKVWPDSVQPQFREVTNITDVVVDAPTESIAIAGTARAVGGGGFGAWVHMLAPNGGLVWPQPFTRNKGFNTSASSAVFGSDGLLRIVGSWISAEGMGSWLGSFSARGVASAVVDHYPIASWSGPFMAIDQSGEIVVLLDAGFAPDDEMWLAKFDLAWQPIWLQPISIPGTKNVEAAGLALSSDGSIVVIGTLGMRKEDGTEGVPSSVWVNRLTAEGDAIWTAPFVRGVDTHEIATSVCVNESGDIYVGGGVWERAMPSHAILMKLSP
jgi:hypothetical protein